MIALSRFLLGLSAAIAALLAVVGALALLALGSAAAIRLVVPNPEVVSGTKPGNNLGRAESSGASPGLHAALAWAQSLQRARLDEEVAARKTNLAIRNWAFTCELVNFDENKKVRAADPAAEPMLERLNQVQDNLFYDRSNRASAIWRDYSVLVTLTMAGIVIGFATTVCAGLRSDDQSLGSWARTVRILAVVFPALGTAIATVLSFYTPRQELLRISQSLVSLQQLHNEVAALSTEACPKNQEDRNKINEKLARWEVKRIQEAPATIAVQISTREMTREGSETGTGSVSSTQTPAPTSH
jgi:hypothetical protein